MTKQATSFVTIDEAFNPYKECIQGLANEPICVLELVRRSWRMAGELAPELDPGEVTQIEIVERLVQNRPRVAIITGSLDHPAHLRDETHMALAALNIWKLGGVPFEFGIPVICDGTAQSNIGQSYSLISRNDTAAAVNINFEGHSYHAAYVLSSCDKFPSAVLSGLASADLARSQTERGQAPVWAVFMPSHVLRGGVIPKDTQELLQNIMDKAEAKGHGDLAHDIEENMGYILQCASDEAFISQMHRASQLGFCSDEEARKILNQLCAATCHEGGGICAFNGTGNSSRTLISALGFAPKEAELLTKEPAPQVVAKGVRHLFNAFNKPEYRVINLVGRNFANAVRVHNATGSSSNILLHLPAIMRYAGYDITIKDYERVRRDTPVPEIFAHSLNHGRDTFVLARQYARGQHQGMESIYKVLSDLGIAMDLDAPTMSGQSWGERIGSLEVPVAPELGEDAVIRAEPVRQASGVEVLKGNIMSSAIIKLAGMSNQQLEHFNDRIFVVRYYEDERPCIADFSSPHIDQVLGKVLEELPEEMVLSIIKHNRPDLEADPGSAGVMDLIKQASLSFAFVIAGQGPKAFGMPEMFAPSQHMRHHSVLEASSVLITDGRYSGVTKGACIGHVTPEAFDQGGLGVLKDGDLLWLRIAEKRLDMINPASLAKGGPVVCDILPREERADLLAQRQAAMQKRRLQIAASNLMTYASNAESGCVPLTVDERATNPLP
jgi:dihydroxy-acid dehydratase